MYQPQKLTVFCPIQRISPAELLKRSKKERTPHEGKLSSFSKPINWNYFKKLTHLTFGRHVNKLFTLPSTITHLTFGEAFNEAVDGKLPDSITHIVFGKKFNHPFTIFPAKLVSITFGEDFHQSMQFPDSLTHLTYRCSTLRDAFPPGLEYLDITSIRKLELPPYPPSLKTLIMNNSFTNQLGTLPKTLTCLHFHNVYFNSSVDNMLLPPSLVELHFGALFDQPLNHLPETLKILHVGKMFKQPLDKLPALKQLIMGGYNYSKQQLLTLPASLTHLIYEHAYNDQTPNLLHVNKGYLDAPLPPLPPGLIALEGVTGQSLAHIPSFPASLRSLLVVFDLQGPIHTLPPACRISIAGSNINWSPAMPFSQVRHLYLENTSPDILFHFTSLTSIVFSETFNATVPLLSDSVISIDFRNAFNQPLSNLPRILQILKCGDAFNYPVTNLPSSLLVLHLGIGFTRPLTALPSGLQKLVIHNLTYDHNLDDLPLSLLDIGLETCGINYSQARIKFGVVGKPEVRHEYIEFLYLE